MMDYHNVEVRQLQTRDGSFLNVDSGMGHVLVWTHAHKRPVLILRHDNFVALAVFDDVGWMKEYLDENWQNATVEHLWEVKEEQE